MAKRGRPAMSPDKKKLTASYSITAEQKYLCEWTAAKLGISASTLIGNIIEKEAKRIAKAQNVKLPEINLD